MPPYRLTIFHAENGLLVTSSAKFSRFKANFGHWGSPGNTSLVVLYILTKGRVKAKKSRPTGAGFFRKVISTLALQCFQRNGAYLFLLHQVVEFRHLRFKDGIERAQLLVNLAGDLGIYFTNLLGGLVVTTLGFARERC